MSTELKTRSKGYSLTRFSMAASTGNVAVQVSTGYNKPYMSLMVQEIEAMFANDDFARVADPLNLLEETVERLKLDLAQFALTKGKGMEAE